jgi:hypothetical protein
VTVRVPLAVWAEATEAKVSISAAATKSMVNFFIWFLLLFSKTAKIYR